MKPRILIVDDEPINLVTFEAFLAAEGYNLQFAQTGREGLQKARELQPDLILLDVMLPEMDGFAVCRQIRSEPEIARIPIILITALNDEPSRLEGLRAGADDFVTKPCLREELRARVQTIVSLNRYRSISEQRARFEQLYELAPAEILLIDEGHRILGANRRAEAGFGRAQSELVGQSIEGCLPGLARDQFDAVVAAARAGREPVAQELRRGEGEGEKILQMRAAVVPERGGLRTMLIFDDVTAEARAREALRTLNAELEDKVRARTRQLEEANAMLMSYASFVSHDLRSPLTVVKGYLALLDEGEVPVSPEAKVMIEHAHRSANTMAEMVSNILQLAQEIHETAGAPGPALSPLPVLRRLVAHVKDVSPNPHTHFKIQGELPDVGVSAVLLERIFFNLLTNAVKYSSHQATPVVEIGGHLEAAGPVLFVRDNGVGFDARDADKLFQEFSRLATGAKSEGLGLGLSLVARLVRTHGGRIWAQSEVGAGATFFVQLPSPAGAVAAAP